MNDRTDESELLTLPKLSRPQRRVLGTLMEKGFTTPDQYPLTLKGLTTGCNQKSNRDPVANYDEDRVAEVIEELRAMGWAAVVYPDSGRTERFRHYMRLKTDLSEQQLAIMAELLLRGRQQVGELRARSSRMAAIDSLDDLRDALADLQRRDLIQASGPLDRRGIEVDHNLYPPDERHDPMPQSVEADKPLRETATASAPSPSPASAAGTTVNAASTEAIETLRTENSELRDRVEQLESVCTDLSDRLSRLERDLGTI